MSVGPIDLARNLIRCPSVTPADAGAIDHLIAALEPLGFTCHDLRFGEGTAQVRNLYARRGSVGPHFCFAGHTDVVPPGDRARWSAEPFGGEIRDGWLLGRGAVDMKGAVASFVAAASRHPRDDGSISLLITGDEEGDAVNGTTKVLDWLEARGESPDVCLVGEPTSARVLGDTIKIGRRGSLTGHLTVEGIAGHTAYPQLADNPAHRLVAMLGRLTAAPLDAGTAHFQPSTLQISTIDIGNPATNVIPGTARAAFNCRFNDLWTGARLDAWLRARIGEAGGDWTLATRISGEAFLTPPGDFADLVAEAVAERTGTRPDFSTTGGTSDARFIRRLCPVAEFGLVGQTMHKADEAVPLADLEALTAIYEAVLARFFAT